MQGRKARRLCHIAQRWLLFRCLLAWLCGCLLSRTLFQLMTKAIQHAAQVQDLAPKAVDAVVKLALEDEELLAGLLNSCIEVGFLTLEGLYSPQSSVRARVAVHCHR